MKRNDPKDENVYQYGDVPCLYNLYLTSDKNLYFFFYGKGWKLSAINDDEPKYDPEDIGIAKDCVLDELAKEYKLRDCYDGKTDEDHRYALEYYIDLKNYIAKETLNEIPFHLESFLESIAEEYTRKANDKGLMFDKAFMGCGITVLGDADRIRQIVVNILENAVKFTRTGYIIFLASY